MKARFSVGVLMYSFRSIRTLILLVFSLVFMAFIARSGYFAYQAFTGRYSYWLVISVALCLTMVASFALIIAVLLNSFGSSSEQVSNEARV